MYDIQYNGIKGSELKIYAKERPEIPAAKRAYEEITVSGKDGTYLRDLGRYENVELPVKMNYMGSESEWHERWREVQRWLSETNGELILSDEPEYYFKVSRVILGNNVRRGKRIGDFNITFVLKDGLYYLKSGKEKYDPEVVKWNPGVECYPIYYLAGTGTCTINVNGLTFEVTMNGTVIIDSERQIVYSEDKRILNNVAKGNYQNLCLAKGENSINITKGFNMKIMPNWRCL